MLLASPLRARSRNPVELRGQERRIYERQEGRGSLIAQIGAPGVVAWIIGFEERSGPDGLSLAAIIQKGPPKTRLRTCPLQLAGTPYRRPPQQ